MAAEGVPSSGSGWRGTCSVIAGTGHLGRSTVGRAKTGVAVSEAGEQTSCLRWWKIAMELWWGNGQGDYHFPPQTDVLSKNYRQ